ncbi:hydroxyacylglutathione hydrolase [Ordospora colligata]|uniref:hydroxyacylglutathione hydrolase n=1 Tax=Ordospora colligata OC4 TaxID=1354746 RepID=A0A0B2ULQ4_9MICR|nr:hydroxyacylglutathione hydrolase [Ordospora colligata OC4]KHN70199.1 hydroxyacylglutathione hydrolase [Ordospora colligata OC4]TBU16743.1 hydroxyacylglutathione hydrolase [Ordospora colligata]TBU17049.1 hydroxyacylglutathione hydrolase [Ordospora colligata]TBU19473.1 hydroxyacylglutathione hydrolase [Ordospora colligata]
MSVFAVSILIGEGKNYMHLIYNEDVMICIDACRFDVLKKALRVEFTESVYSAQQILAMEDCTNERRLVCVLTTHRHSDHIGGIDELKSEMPSIRLISGFEDEICAHGDILDIEGIEVECIHTPCHTSDSFCYYIARKYLATGDTLFLLGCGKFFEGTARQMIDAIEKIKARVDPEALMLYGHDYNEQNIRFTENFYIVPKSIKNKRFLKLQDEAEYNLFFDPRRAFLYKSVNIACDKQLITGKEPTEFISTEDAMTKLRARKDLFNRQ